MRFLCLSGRKKGEKENMALRIERVRKFIDERGLDIELHAPLNSGSFGTVFVGRYRGDKVAVKVERITKHDIESLKTEYQVYRALHHKGKKSDGEEKEHTSRR